MPGDDLPFTGVTRRLRGRFALRHAPAALRRGRRRGARPQRGSPAGRDRHARRPGGTQEANTDGSSAFVFSGVAPGRYSIQSSPHGVRDDVEHAHLQRCTSSVVLTQAVGTLTESITVEAEAPTVDTLSASATTVLHGGSSDWRTEAIARAAKNEPVPAGAVRERGEPAEARGGSAAGADRRPARGHVLPVRAPAGAGRGDDGHFAYKRRASPRPPPSTFRCPREPCAVTAVTTRHRRCA